MGVDRKIEAMRERLERFSPKPCTATVSFTDGSKITLPYLELFGRYDEGGNLIESDIERRGWAGEVLSVEVDDWTYANMAALVTALWRPAHEQDQ